MIKIRRYSREHIEEIAERILGWANPRALKHPQPSPIPEIVAKLVNKGKVAARFDVPLGYSERGLKIFGAFDFDPPMIYVDPVLDQFGPRYRFTLAHELGHFVLHRRLRISSEEIDVAEGVRDSRAEFFFGHKAPNTRREWLEWQANAFASAIQVPRATVALAILDIQSELGIRRRGRIFVDRQPCNLFDYGRVMQQLQTIYQTSRTMMVIRLRHLNLLDDQRSGLKHVATLFRTDQTATSI